MTENPLQKILSPASIAFFGASNNILTMGTSQLNNVISGGFSGKIFPVHPKEEQILGLKAYKSVMDIPEVVDLAVMIIPTRLVPPIMEECGKKGIKRAIVMSGGFSERGEEGSGLEKDIISIAKKYDIRFVGPNCIGVCNTHLKFNTTWFPYFHEAGNIGLASQSGTYACHTFNYFSKVGIALSYSISVGNEANIDIVDCIEFLAEDSNTRVIALYIEGIRRGKEFIKVARKVSKKKPIVALYVGGTKTGARACASHTAVLSGSGELYRGVFKQAGVIQVDTVEELFDASLALSTQPPLRCRKIAILTTSGGPAVSFADACEKSGLEVPVLPQNIQDKIRKFIPDTASSVNPIDLTFTMDIIQLFFDTLPRILFEEANIDGILIYGIFDVSNLFEIMMRNKNISLDRSVVEQMKKMGEDIVDRFCRALERYKKPVIGCSFYGSEDDEMIAFLQDKGIPFFPSPERAVKAMAALYRWGNGK